MEYCKFLTWGSFIFASHSIWLRNIWLITVLSSPSIASNTNINIMSGMIPFLASLNSTLNKNHCNGVGTKSFIAVLAPHDRLFEQIPVRQPWKITLVNRQMLVFFPHNLIPFYWRRMNSTGTNFIIQSTVCLNWSCRGTAKKKHTTWYCGPFVWK